MMKEQHFGWIIGMNIYNNIKNEEKVKEFNPFQESFLRLLFFLLIFIFLKRFQVPNKRLNGIKMHYKRKYELCYQVASTYSLFLECKNGCGILKNTYFISIKAHFQELPILHQKEPIDLKSTPT